MDFEFKTKLYSCFKVGYSDHRMKNIKLGGQLAGPVMPAFRQPNSRQRWVPSSNHRCLVMASSDPYKVLKITRGSSMTDIKAAYYQQMKEMHPDVNPDRDTTDEAVQLNIAYTALLQGQNNSI